MRIFSKQWQFLFDNSYFKWILWCHLFLVCPTITWSLESSLLISLLQLILKSCMLKLWTDHKKSNINMMQAFLHRSAVAALNYVQLNDYWSHLCTVYDLFIILFLYFTVSVYNWGKGMLTKVESSLNWHEDENLHLIKTFQWVSKSSKYYYRWKWPNPFRRGSNYRDCCIYDWKKISTKNFN